MEHKFFCIFGKTGQIDLDEMLLVDTFTLDPITEDYFDDPSSNTTIITDE